MTRDEILSATKPQGGMFAVIPSVVMKDQNLSMSAKLLYGIITWKCNDYAFCWATNRTLGEDLGLSEKRVSSLISDLEETGHIEVEILRDEETNQVLQRRIYPIVKSGRKAGGGGRGGGGGGGGGWGGAGGGARGGGGGGRGT